MPFQINTITTFSESTTLQNACRMAIFNYIKNTVQNETSGLNPSDTNHKIYQKRQALCRAFYQDPKKYSRIFAEFLTHQYPNYEFDKQGTELSATIIGERVLECKTDALSTNSFDVTTETDTLQIFNMIAGCNQNDLI